MFSNIRLRLKNEPTQQDFARSKLPGEVATTNESGSDKTSKSSRAKTQGSRGDNSFYQREAKLITIASQDYLSSLAFFPDGKHIVSGRSGGELRRWRVDDGREVGMPIDWKGPVTISRDGKWIVSQTEHGKMAVWNAKTHEKVTELMVQPYWANVVDISLDGTRIVTGSHRGIVCVWSRSKGKQLLGPWEHRYSVVTAKFSPDGFLIATATAYDSGRVYNAKNGALLFGISIDVGLTPTESCLAWASDSKQLFVLSRNGVVYCLAVSTGTTLRKWAIPDYIDAGCITLSSNGTFIAASAGSSVSLFDTMSGAQIGPIIENTHPVRSMVISDNATLATGGDKTISLHSLCNTLPPPYLGGTTVPRIQDAVNLEKTVQELHIQLSESQLANKSLSGSVGRLEKDNQALCRKVANSQRTVNEQNETIRSLRLDLQTQEITSSRQLEDLKDSIRQLSNQLATSQRTADDEKNSFCETIDSLRAQGESSNNEISHLKQASQLLQEKNDCLLRIIRAYEQKHQCEALYARGRIYEAARCILEMSDTVKEDVKTNKLLSDWLIEFTERCIQTLEKIGDEASNAGEREDTVAAYAAVLSLGVSTLHTVLTKWASSVLTVRSVREALSTAVEFKVPRIAIYRTICNILEGDGRLTEAVECLREMCKLPDDATIHDERAKWELEFRERGIEKLVKLGDTARDSRKHDEAIGYYSNALSLDPTNPYEIFLKRSDELIQLDPSSHKGYEEKHAALNGMGRYSEAFEAFRMMLSKLEDSSDSQIRELRNQYLDATPLIQQAVQQTISPIPRILIDTFTGRLYDKTYQAAAFEELPIYNQLRSSMTTRTLLDHRRIRAEVKKFYRYVMFSHRWEYGEPPFQRVQSISIYELESSAPNIKLQTFCEIIRALGFQWVWSDTCCIDKKDNVVLQESLVAMFTWYRGSSLTLVYLRGVWSHSQKPGDLRRSIWNTRVWTYQEYVAAETVQFYTEDWKPYLGLDVFNHKESPAIIAEMEQASGVSAQQLAVLRPGLERVREKLFLAAVRQTTLVEDTAYSLLGIFDASIPVIYGERYRAVGRLLEHVLTGSGDVAVLAWTGCAGAYNSCLPIDLGPYSQVVPPHVPLPIEKDEMNSIVTALRSSDLSSAVILCAHLHKLPSPFMAASRLRLAGITFPITKLAYIEPDVKSEIHVYHAMTAALGDVEIRTTDDLRLTTMENFIFIHPWISSLLDQEFSHHAVGLDDTTRALRLVARLRQPFGALLLAPLSRVKYKRVATDCLIVVRISEETGLTELIDGIRTVDIQ